MTLSTVTYSHDEDQLPRKAARALCSAVLVDASSPSTERGVYWQVPLDSAPHSLHLTVTRILCLASGLSSLKARPTSMTSGLRALKKRSWSPCDSTRSSLSGQGTPERTGYGGRSPAGVISSVTVPLDTPIQDLGLGSLASNKLRRAGIKDLRDLLARREEVMSGDLAKRTFGMGKKIQEEIERNMSRLERLAGPEGLAVLVLES